MQVVNCLETEKSNEINKINSAVVIPALNPVPNLVNLVRTLLEQGVPQVIVVNDGSDRMYNGIFQSLEQLEHCTVLTHRVNRGKGRALKTAFQYFIEHCADLDGVVTADADGQHMAEDICCLCRKLAQERNSLILGVRNFQEGNIPKRSFLGNLVTSRIFWLLYGYYLQDTQTGLRGIPAGELAWMIEMKGERYDYEINMLIQARFHNLSLSLVPIKTLYFDNNAGSHYKTVSDSLRVFQCLISGLIDYAKTTIASGMLDLFLFFMFNSIVFAGLLASVRILLSTFLARLFSSACNFTLNRRIIFAGTGKLACSACRYYILWLSLLLASYGLVYSLSLFWAINVVVIKVAVDFFLGFISYQLQLRWVFRKEDSHHDGLVFIICRFFVRRFTLRYRVYALNPQALVEPAVYVVHHQNLQGPVITLAWFDRPLRPWVLSVFCERAACYRQYYQYTFTERFGLPKAFAAIISYPLSFAITKLMQGAGAVPVFRNSKDIYQTFKQSIFALTQGHNLLIAPDIDYKDTGTNIGEIYTGFLDLEKLYYQQVRKHLAFVPLCVCKETRCILVGKSVYFQTGGHYKREKEKVVERLRQEFLKLENRKG